MLLWYDDKPLCIISYEEIPEAILIKQIQAFPLETSVEKKLRTDSHQRGMPYRKSNDNFLLNSFDWTNAMVHAIEELAQIR